MFSVIIASTGKYLRRDDGTKAVFRSPDQARDEMRRLSLKENDDARICVAGPQRIAKTGGAQ